MKVPVFSSLILALGLSSPVLGIERPKSLDDAPPKKHSRDVPRAVEVAPDPEAIPRAVPAEDRPAWLGVFSEPVDETLASHLGIDVGVVLRFVADDSPAAAAGLKQHDVVTSVDGEAVRGQEGLRDAVQQHEPGDEIALEVVSGGVKANKSVKLTERPENLPGLPQNRLRRPNFPPQAGEGRLPEMRRQLEELEKLFPQGAEDLRRQLEEQMKKAEEHLDRMQNLPELGLNLDLQEMLEDLPKRGNEFNFDLKMAGSFKLMDDEGSVEMKMRDGGKEVEVRNKQGDVIWEGPWDTAQDKAGAPPEVRERIERLDFNGKGGALRFHFENNPLERLDKPEAEPEEPQEEPDAL